MKKVQLFAEASVELLQHAINSWLAENKAIGIIRADMQCSPANGGVMHYFYILYEGMESTAEVALANQAQDVIPDGLTPDSGEIQLQ